MNKIPIITWIIFTWASTMLFVNAFVSFGIWDYKLNIFVWTLIGVCVFRFLHWGISEKNIWGDYIELTEFTFILMITSAVLLILKMMRVLP
ncbi:MAG: hypothetical protein AB7V77_00625 [Candidatus Woesearchaeota archaeon]